MCALKLDAPYDSDESYGWICEKRLIKQAY